MVSASRSRESSSFWAQGGLAAAIGDDDSPELHVEDTLAAGRGPCRRSAAELLAREAPGVVAELRAPRRRVRPRPGRQALARASRAGTPGAAWSTPVAPTPAGGSPSDSRSWRAVHERIEVIEETSAVALWSDGERCHGVITDRGPMRARATILATGGAAALWARTTNPWGAIGAGPVMAHAAGAEIADLELCQFHPTALARTGNPL